MASRDNKFSDIRDRTAFPDPKSVTVSDIVEDVWETYVDEIKTFLQDIEKAAMAIESSDNEDNNEKELAEIRRILHSIKGDSGMAGINDVHDLCHELESDLDSVFDSGGLDLLGEFCEFGLFVVGEHR